MKGHPNVGPFQRSIKTFDAFAKNDRGIGHEFWLFHGINHLSGCPFPKIYQGDIPARGLIFSHIMSAHLDKNQLTQRGRECLVWASASAKELFRAVTIIKAFAAKYRKYWDSPLAPKNADFIYERVAVETLAKLMTDGPKEWGALKPPSPETYYQTGKAYDSEMSQAAYSVTIVDPKTRDGWEFWANIHRQTIKTYGMPAGLPPIQLEFKERDQIHSYRAYKKRMDAKKKLP